MKRRAFTTLLGGTAAAWPLAVVGQQRPRVIGVVFVATPLSEMTGPDPISPQARDFVYGLRDLGWVEGQNLVIERRTMAANPERAPAILAELVGRGVDVIVLSASLPLIEAGLKATAKVPLVANFPQDSDTLGLFASFARPGGNLTGIGSATTLGLAGKRLQMLKELAPRATRIAFVGTKQQQELYPPDAGPAGTRLVPIVVEQPNEFADAFATILRERADAIHLQGNAVHYVQREQVIAFAASHGLPASYAYRQAVEEGGLVAYGPSVAGVWRKMAGQVDRVLRGDNPADMPIELPERFELIINRKTAQALGLTIPPTLEAQAEVIE